MLVSLFDYIYTSLKKKDILELIITNKIIKINLLQLLVQTQQIKSLTWLLFQIGTLR